MPFIMLKERDQRRPYGYHLARRDVHIIDLVHRHVFCLSVIVADKRILCKEITVGVKFLVSLGNNMPMLLVSSHIDDIIRDMPVFDLTVRGLDETERVDAGECRQATDKADIRAFRGFDRAHTSEMGRMDIAHFHRRTVTRQAAGAEGGQAALVGHARQRVVLVKELRQLGCPEELFDRCSYRTNIQKGLGGYCLRVLGRHTLAGYTFHTGQARAQLCLDQLAHLADTAVAEIINIICIYSKLDILAVTLPGENILPVMQGHEIFHCCKDIFAGKAAVLIISVKSKLAVDLVPPNAGQIITLVVEIEGLQKITPGFRGSCVPRADTAVKLSQGLVLCDLRLLGQCLHDQRIIFESLGDLTAGHAYSLKEDYSRLLALAVNTDAEHITLVYLELEPCAAARDNLRIENFLIRCPVRGTAKVNTRGTYQLGYDNALGPTDNKGAVLGHQREITHKNGL